MIRVFVARIEDPSYPRNHRIRAYLERHGYHVEAHLRSRAGGARGFVADVRAIARGARSNDVVLVSEMSLPYVPFAWFAARARRRLLVVDGFVRKYETAVVDRGLYPRWSFRALRDRAVDALSIRLSDIYLTDTEVRAEELSAAYPRRRVVSLPVGAPAWAVPAPHRPQDGVLRVLFYGSFLALHGTDTIVRAIARMETRTARLTLVGTADHEGGPATLAALARDLGISDRIVMHPDVPAEELARIIADHDVVLGLFGASHKASGVIANKVWQGLACGRTVVTRESPALAEISGIVGASQLRTVPPADPGALAAVLDELARRPRVDVPRLHIALEEYTASRFDGLNALIARELWRVAGDRRDGRRVIRDVKGSRGAACAARSPHSDGRQTDISSAGGTTGCGETRT